MKRVALGVMFAAAAVLGVSFMGCDKKIENSELKKEDAKGTATIELVLGAKLSDETDAPFEAVPAGAKVIVTTTDGALLGNGGDKAIVIKEESLSGKHMTLKVPVSVKGTEYTLTFTASDPANYEVSGEAKSFYYEPANSEETMTLLPGGKEVLEVVYASHQKAEL